VNQLKKTRAGEFGQLPKWWRHHEGSISFFGFWFREF